VGRFLRTPLDVFAGLVVIGAIIIAVGMKELGGTSSGYAATPLSSQQFAQLNEHACISLRRQLKAVTHRTPRTFTDAARSVRRTAAILAGLNMELDGQIPPPAEVARFRQLLRSIQTADRAMQQLDRLTGSRQWGSATILVRARSWREMRNQRQSATAEKIRCGRARSTDAILTAVAMRAADGAAAASYYFAKPLSPAQFAAKLQHICVSARARLEDITSRKPTSLPDAASIIGTLTMSLDGWLQELRGLTPPPSFAAPFRYVLDTLRREQSAMHNLDELASSGQWQRGEALIRSPGWHAMLDRLGPPVKPADIRCG
jgi:hypothetical protein